MNDAAAERLLSIYLDAEVLILAEMRRAFHNGAWASWANMANKDHNLQQLIARVRRILATADTKAGQQLATLAAEDYTAALEEVMREVSHTAPLQASASGLLVAERAAVATRTALASTHLQVIRQVRDVYQSITTQTVQTALLAGVNHQTAMRHAFNQYANRGITAFTDAAGRKWGLDSYVDMSIRTMRNQVTQEAHIDGYQQSGVELVRASWHPASAPQCFPFQNQLLAISGGAGPRTMTDPATGEQVTVHVKDTLRGAISKGYHHPNCKHRDVAYTPGDPTPTGPTADLATNLKQYKASQKQRRLERQKRRWKRREAAALTPEDRQQARQHIKATNQRLRDHVAEHPHLSRAYHREGDRTRQTTK